MSESLVLGVAATGPVAGPPPNSFRVVGGGWDADARVKARTRGLWARSNRLPARRPWLRPYARRGTRGLRGPGLAAPVPCSALPGRERQRQPCAGSGSRPASGSGPGAQGWERQRQPFLALGPALVRCATEGTSKARKEAASLRVPSALGTGPALKARLVCRWLESSLVCACACLRGRRGPAGPRLCRRGKARLGLGVCWGGSEWRGKGGGGRVRLVMRERSESSDKGDSAQALSGRGGG